LNGARHPTQGLEGLDHRGQPPGFDRLAACLCATLQAFGVLMHGADVCLEDALLGGGGTDHFGEPPPMGWAPGGPARRTDIVAEPKGVAPTRGGLESVDGRFTRTGEVADGLICHRGNRDPGQSPRAHQPGQWDGVTPVRFHTVAGLGA